MRIIICAACKTMLGIVGPDQEAAQALAVAHMSACTASEEEYEQAIYDIRFREIAEGLDL